MTLPPFMNRNRNLHEIEAEVVLALCGMMSKSFEVPSPKCNTQNEAACIVDASRPSSFVDPATTNAVTLLPSTPPPPPKMLAEKKKKKKNKKSTTATTTKKKKRVAMKEARAARRGAPCSIPTKRDPIDESFLATLHSDRDVGRINPAHVEVRKFVLEVRRTVSGRVFFQCRHCAHLDGFRCAKQSIIAPQTVERLYRANVRFMMDHVEACKYIPDYIKKMNASALRLTERGIPSPRSYWAQSARAMGLRNDVKSKCIVFGPASVQASNGL